MGMVIWIASLTAGAVMRTTAIAQINSDETWVNTGGAECRAPQERQTHQQVFRLVCLLGLSPQQRAQFPAQSLFAFNNSCLPADLFENHHHINVCWQRMVTFG